MQRILYLIVQRLELFLYHRDANVYINWNQVMLSVPIWELYKQHNSQLKKPQITSFNNNPIVLIAFVRIYFQSIVHQYIHHPTRQEKHPQKKAWFRVAFGSLWTNRFMLCAKADGGYCLTLMTMCCRLLGSCVMWVVAGGNNRILSPTGCLRSRHQPTTSSHLPPSLSAATTKPPSALLSSLGHFVTNLFRRYSTDNVRNSHCTSEVHPFTTAQSPCRSSAT